MFWFYKTVGGNPAIFLPSACKKYPMHTTYYTQHFRAASFSLHFNQQMWKKQNVCWWRLWSINTQQVCWPDIAGIIL